MQAVRWEGVEDRDGVAMGDTAQVIYWDNGAQSETLESFGKFYILLTYLCRHDFWSKINTTLVAFIIPIHSMTFVF